MAELKKYSLGPGRSISTDQKPISMEEWRREGAKLFGLDYNNWRFRCPMCGKSWTLREFVRVSRQADPNLAFQECIGRYFGAGSPGADDGNPRGCNWASYGLFGIPNKNGLLVSTGEDEVIEIFDFDREVSTYGEKV